MLKSTINFNAKNLLYEIEKENNIIISRGFKVKEKLFTQISINPFYCCIDFNSRKFNWKYFAGELAWYLLQSRNIKFIKNFSNFWDNLKNDDNTINSNYGYILFTKNKKTNNSGMSWIVNSLKKDKYTRQAIAYFGGKEYQYEKNKDFVCTQYILFFIRDNKLYMKVQMRSNDIFYGLTYDAVWFSTVQQNVLFELKNIYPNLELGNYYHYSDNTHYYERHFDVVKKILQEEITIGPKLVLKEPLWYTYENGEIELSFVSKKYLEWFDKNLNKIPELKRKEFLEPLSIIFNIEIS